MIIKMRGEYLSKTPGSVASCAVLTVASFRFFVQGSSYSYESFVKCADRTGPALRKSTLSAVDPSPCR